MFSLCSSIVLLSSANNFITVTLNFLSGKLLTSVLFFFFSWGFYLFVSFGTHLSPHFIWLSVFLFFCFVLIMNQVKHIPLLILKECFLFRLCIPVGFGRLGEVVPNMGGEFWDIPSWDLPVGLAGNWTGAYMGLGKTQGMPSWSCLAGVDMN